MRSILFVCMCLCSFAFGQNINGSWKGKLDVGGIQLTLILNASDTSWTIDSPDQGAFGIKIDSSSFNDGNLFFMVSRIGAQYNGVYLKDDAGERFEGEFNQMGQKFPLILNKMEQAYEQPKRPQEPQAPFPYKIKDVTFDCKTADGETIELAGTLTYPAKGKPNAAVVLVSGSGAQNRDEELMGHKPFWVIADYLTRNGIAVLRYDDRGVGESEGKFSAATTYDFADDAEAAHTFLSKKFKKAKVGIAGHSEGGLVAPIVAARNESVDFIMLLAGPGTPMDHLLIRQTSIIMELNGASPEEIAEEAKLARRMYDWVMSDHPEKDIERAIVNLIDDAFKKRPDAYEGEDINQVKLVAPKRLMSPWFRAIVKMDPEKDLTKVKCPVMAINGEKDCQVPCAENLEAIEKHLAKAGNQHVLIKAYPDLNHLFQKSETGSMDEYSFIEETWNEDVLKDMVKWINALK